jgi:hypothetical protein
VKWAALAVVALGGVAHADPPPPAPTFAQQGFDGERTEASAELGLVTGEPHLLERGAFGVQYVSAGGAGGYLGGNASHLDESGSGALDLGALYHTRGKAFTVTFRGGFGIATSHPYYLDPAEEAQQIGTEVVRPADVALTVPANTTLRFALSPQYRQGAFALRMDFGVDTAVGGTFRQDEGTALHGAIGLGIAKRAFAATLESSAVHYNTLNGYRWMYGVAATVEVRTGRWRPYLGATGLLGDTDAHGDLSMIAGVRVRL